MSATTDHELGFLMSLHGFEFQFGRGHVVKIAARIEVTKHRPMGSSPASRCTDPAGRRIYGMDNAHGIRHQTEYDHRHVYGARKMLPYKYQGPAELPEACYREIARILRERGER